MSTTQFNTRLPDSRLSPTSPKVVLNLYYNYATRTFARFLTLLWFHLLFWWHNTYTTIMPPEQWLDSLPCFGFIFCSGGIILYYNAFDQKDASHILCLRLREPFPRSAIAQSPPSQPCAKPDRSLSDRNFFQSSRDRDHLASD